VTLKEACAFDEVFEWVCARRGLRLRYLGSLATRWEIGPRPDPVLYNTWVVIALGEGGATPRHRPIRRRRAADGAGIGGPGEGEKQLFFVTVGRFRGRNDAVHLKTEAFEFDVLLKGMDLDPFDIDREFDVLGTTPREFVKGAELFWPVWFEL